MAQQVRAYTAVAEGLGPIPSIHLGALQTICNPATEKGSEVSARMRVPPGRHVSIHIITEINLDMLLKDVGK